MRLLQPNAIVQLVAIVFCLQVCVLFVALSRRPLARGEHLTFGLFNLFLACMMACRLAIFTAPASRHVALGLFRWHCVAGAGAVATFQHFTGLITRRNLSTRSAATTLYVVAILMAACFFLPGVLHLAPLGTDPGRYDEQEVGPLFAYMGAALILCGMAPCLLLHKTIRGLQEGPAESTPESADQAADLIVLRRHLTLIFRATLVLMVMNLVDLAWFMSPVSDSPISFSALGMICLSLTIAVVLARDIIDSEQRKLRLASIARARLHALTDTQHQLKNQLVAVRLPLASGLRAMERGNGAAFVSGKLRTALAEADGCAQTLDTMLNVARAEAGAPLDLGPISAIDLPALLADVCARRAALEECAAEERWELHNLLPPELVLVRAGALRQILVNLIDNAFKYSAADSLVRAEIGLEAGADMLYIRIRDTGQGIGAADMDRIFTVPFYRGHADTRAIPGAGLGLNMANRYVKAMGGTLTAYSDGPGRGAMFELRLSYAPQVDAGTEG